MRHVRAVGAAVAVAVVLVLAGASSASAAPGDGGLPDIPSLINADLEGTDVNVVGLADIQL